MANEVEIVRRAFEAPEMDPKARERAHARLQQAIASEERLDVARARRRSLPRRLNWLAVACTIPVVAFVAQALVPAHRDAPASSSSASGLRRLVGVAASSPELSIPEGSFRYLSSREVGVAHDELGLLGYTDVKSGLSVLFSVDRTVETWLASDGSGRRTTATHSVSFATERDRRTWVEMGSPELPQLGRSTETFGPGELMPYDVSTLPTDAQSLDHALRTQGLNGGALDDGQLFHVIAFLLSDANPPADLRAALFMVLADLPGIEFRGSVQDPRHRTGDSLQMLEGSSMYELIVDPATSAVLAKRIVPVSRDALPPSWQAYTASGVVDRAGVSV